MSATYNYSHMTLNQLIAARDAAWNRAEAWRDEMYHCSGVARETMYQNAMREVRIYVAYKLEIESRLQLQSVAA